MKTAGYWHADGDMVVTCELCPNSCRIHPGRSGSCGVRSNAGGSLSAESYGLLSSSHIDPIEKKPLYHFRPGSEIFSIGGWGCNLHCSFCQNWSISQEFIRGETSYSPEQVIAAAEKSGTNAIAYTYNEPFVALEFVLDCCRVARERGIRNVAVTNGYITGRAAADAVEAIDAFNVDIKSMDSDFYRRNCGGRLEPVLEFCIAARRAGKHIEITNLIIPGENDSDGLILELAAWVACNLGREVPVHFSAYRPEFRMKKPATGVGILNRAYELAADGLDYVYLGNVVSERGQDTICPGCGSTLVARRVYSTAVRGVKDGRCSSCGFKLEGFVWQGE